MREEEREGGREGEREGEGEGERERERERDYKNGVIQNNAHKITYLLIKSKNQCNILIIGYATKRRNQKVKSNIIMTIHLINVTKMYTSFNAVVI